MTAIRRRFEAVISNSGSRSKATRFSIFRITPTSDPLDVERMLPKAEQSIAQCHEFARGSGSHVSNSELFALFLNRFKTHES